MKQRFYFDTSVFGGVFDVEFEEASVQLFEQVKLGQPICVYSDLTEGELFDAPERVKAFFRDLSKESLESVKVNEEAVRLAKSYIAEKWSVRQAPTIAYILLWRPFIRLMCWLAGISGIS